MKETIATIPVNDLFAPKDGCPFCRMERMLEEQYCEFVTGDAMMEPLIRIETNKKGFCNRHFTRMTQVGQKLPNALILESHLQCSAPAMCASASPRTCSTSPPLFFRNGQRAASFGRPTETSRLSACTTTAL